MTGKRGLIMGLANDRSLAWGIAKQLARAWRRAGLLATRARRSRSGCARSPSSSGSDLLVDCDVSRHGRARPRVRGRSKKRWDSLDFVVHAIGFSDKNELRGGYVDTSLDNFLMTMNISVYSFVAVAQRARGR